MKTRSAVAIGALIWFLGVLAFSVSFYVPVLEDMELQANLVLCIAVLPLVWLGARFYYRKGVRTHGFVLGIIFFATAALLDALITVPILILPHGGSYYEFFTDMGFWGIALEFVGTAVLYWYFNVKRTREFI